MILEQLGALAAIFTFVGALCAGGYHLIQKSLRRRIVQKYLEEAFYKHAAVVGHAPPSVVPHRFLNQMAADLRMTSRQAYDAAIGNKNVKPYQTGGADGKFWFVFIPPNERGRP